MVARGTCQKLPPGGRLSRCVHFGPLVQSSRLTRASWSVVQCHCRGTVRSVPWTLAVSCSAVKRKGADYAWGIKSKVVGWSPRADTDGCRHAWSRAGGERSSDREFMPKMPSNRKSVAVGCRRSPSNPCDCPTVGGHPSMGLRPGTPVPSTPRNTRPPDVAGLQGRAPGPTRACGGGVCLPNTNRKAGCASYRTRLSRRRRARGV